MSDDEDAPFTTPHQATIYRKEQANGTVEINRRIAALRQQVAKYDAIDYRQAQLEFEHKKAKEMREQIKEEEAAYVERKQLYIEQNVELVNVIKDHKKESLFNSKKALKTFRDNTCKERRDQSLQHAEYLEMYNEEDAEYRKELRGMIVEAKQEQTARRQKFIADRAKAIRKEKDLYVSSTRAVCDSATEEMANLILKEARIIRQLIKLREAHAEKEKGNGDGEDSKNATTKSV